MIVGSVEKRVVAELSGGIVTNHCIEDPAVASCVEGGVDSTSDTAGGDHTACNSKVSVDDGWSAPTVPSGGFKVEANPVLATMWCSMTIGLMSCL